MNNWLGWAAFGAVLGVLTALFDRRVAGLNWAYGAVLAMLGLLGAVFAVWVVDGNGGYSPTALFAATVGAVLLILPAALRRMHVR